MLIKQDPITGLYCRSDGAVLMPPSGAKFRSFRWTFGTSKADGYRSVRHRYVDHLVHRVVCRAFNGLPPEGKLFVDHINRIKNDNRPENLHWVSSKENCDNQDKVDRSIAKYKVRRCDDLAAYGKVYNKGYERAQRAKGLTHRKGPDGRWGWYPRVRKSEAA